MYGPFNVLSLILDGSPGAFSRLRYLNVCSDTHGEYCQLKNFRYKVHICAENLSATSVILGSFSTHCPSISGASCAFCDNYRCVGQRCVISEVDK